MFINLKKFKAPEIRKLASAYNKLNNIPHPSTLKKADLIKYLKEHLETNNKGYLNIESLHPKLKKTIQPGIDRLKEQYEESKKNFDKTLKDIEEEIKNKYPKKEAQKPYRDTITKEQRDAQDRRMRHFIETGQILRTE